MPRLEHHPGDGLPVLRVAQDKAVLGGVGREPLVGAGIGKAGVLGSVVRAEDVGRIAGAVLVGVGFGRMAAARADASSSDLCRAR